MKPDIFDTVISYNAKLSNDCLHNGKGLYLLNCSHTGTHLHCGSSSFYKRNLWAKVICCMLKSQSLWLVLGLYNFEHDLRWREKGSVNMQFVMKHDPRFFWLFIPSAWVTSSSCGFWLVEVFATKVKTFKIKCNVRRKFKVMWCLVLCTWGLSYQMLTRETKKPPKKTSSIRFSSHNELNNIFLKQMINSLNS